MRTKRELMSKPNRPQRGQAERPNKQPPQHPVDPGVAARERGAFAGAEVAPPTATSEPGRPQLPRGPPPFGAYCIPEFCCAHSLSESFFHKLMTEDRGPKVMRIGRRTLVSIEAAGAWRARQEAAAENHEQRSSPPAT